MWDTAGNPEQDSAILLTQVANHSTAFVTKLVVTQTYLVTAEPPLCRVFSVTGDGDFRDFLGGESAGERLLLFKGDLDLGLLSFEGEGDELCLYLLSSLFSLSPLVDGDLDRDCL